MSLPATVTVRAVTTLQSFRTSGGAAKDPLTHRLEFTSQRRIENQGVILGPNGAVEINISDESMTRLDLLRIAAMTPNRSFVLKFDGDPTGVEYVAPAPSLRAFFMGTCNANIIRIENPSNSQDIEIEFSLFQRAD